jgi:hypothetical protein
MQNQSEIAIRAITSGTFATAWRSPGNRVPGLGMKIPSRHILKTVTAITRHEADASNHNLHIGRTLRELEMHTQQKSSEHLQSLLDSLEQSERRLRN